MVEITERRLFWDGCINVRDLGGFYIRDGRRTRWGALVRMDNPGHLTNEGIRAMLDYGVNTVIDLRYPTEITNYPQLIEAVQTDFGAPLIMSIPLLDEANRIDEDATFARSRDAWHEYVLDRRGETMAEVLRAIAHARPGTVAYHCAAGKDRTGIVSALLLDLADVSRDEIVQDYAVSEEWLRPRTEQWLQPLDEAQRVYARGLMRTAPEFMRHMLGYLDARYGGTADYMRQIGLSDAEITALRTRLLE
jgi:protein-tyrosine phosphatase